MLDSPHVMTGQTRVEYASAHFRIFTTSIRPTGTGTRVVRVSKARQPLLMLFLISASSCVNCAGGPKAIDPRLIKS